MNNENKEKYQCPECESKNIRFKFKVNNKNKNKNDPYSHVTEEIQCAECFMDIPPYFAIVSYMTFDNSTLSLNPACCRVSS